ncbi:hypothetical protein C3R30_21825, partial [Mycobacterium tuberculosis]
PLGLPLPRALVRAPPLRLPPAAGPPGAPARALAPSFVGPVVGSLARVRSARSVVLALVAAFLAPVGPLPGLVPRCAALARGGAARSALRPRRPG